MTEREHQLLERLAGDGKVTRLFDAELGIARKLETDGLLFLVGTSAVVTPKARRLLVKEAQKPKRDTPPFKFT
jgi:hypothetical protein